MKTNFFFLYDNKDEDEQEEYDGPHAHLTNDWYDVMGSLHYVYWEKNSKYREEAF